MSQRCSSHRTASDSQDFLDMVEIREENSTLLNEWQVKIIVMFGVHSEKCLISDSISKRPIRLELPLGNVDGFLEIKSTSVQRVYIRCPIQLGSLKSLHPLATNK